MLDFLRKPVFRDEADRAALRFRVVDRMADLAAVTALARQVHAESRLHRIPFSEAKLRRLVERALGDPNRHSFMLAERGSEPVGLLHCSAGEYFIGTDTILVTVHSVNVPRRHRGGLGGGRIAMGLLNGARTWARARGAVELSVHVSSGTEMDRTDRLLRHLGFAHTGGNYALDLGPRGGAR